MNFVLRPSTKKGRHPGSLFLRIIHNRRVKTVTLPGCRIYPEEWNSDTQEIIYPENNSRRTGELETLEQLIHYEKELVETHLSTLQKKGRYKTEDVIRLYRQKKNENKVMGYAEILALSLEQGGQQRTANAYRTVARGIVKFNKGADIPLRQINSTLVKEYETYLKQTDKMPNTISFHMRNLRAVFNKAVAENIINKPREDPFAGVYTGVAKTVKRSLSVDEMQQFHDLDFAELIKSKEVGSRAYEYIDNLSRAWRYFLFCFYTRGMSFIDLAFLRKDNIRGNIIRYNRRKTGQHIEIRVTREAQAIIDSFTREVRNSPYVFPVINDRDNGITPYDQYRTALRSQNTRLKKMAKLAGINKRISTHVSRHTWASIAKYKNIPIPIISDCLGHTDEKTTRIYMDSLDNGTLDSANELIIAAVVCPAK